MNTLTTNNNINFKGYDARRLKALVMNTNYAGIADEVKKIGEIENFKVLLIERKPFGLVLKTDEFELSASHKGAWAQDDWGVVKNTLLTVDNRDEKTQVWRKVFGLDINKFQAQKQEESGMNKTSQYVDLLYNLPIINKNGKQLVQVPTDNGIVELDKTILDAEININMEVLKNTSKQCHVKGGNYFLTKGENGEEELLIGQNELKKFTIPELKEMFMTDKIHIIPQADYHLDLFMRPLKDKKVLIADDNMMCKLLADGFKRIQEMIISKPRNERMQYKDVFVKVGAYAQNFENITKQNPYADLEKVEEELLKSGYEPIKVPGRLFEILGEVGNMNDISKYILKPLHNFMNAIVHINNKGETVYITNKSTIDQTLGLTEEIQKETGFGLEKAFREAVKPYVDKFYFVSGKNNEIANELLPEYYGGIHCMTMEVPH